MSVIESLKKLEALEQKRTELRRQLVTSIAIRKIYNLSNDVAVGVRRTEFSSRPFGGNVTALGLPDGRVDIVVDGEVVATASCKEHDANMRKILGELA